MESQARTHTLIRLQIDEIKPNRVTAMGLVLIFLIGLFFILSLIVPYPFFQYYGGEKGYCVDNLNQYGNFSSNCSNPFNMSSNPVFMTRVSNVTGMNQLLYLTGVFRRSANYNPVAKETSFSMQFSVGVYEYNDQNSILQEISQQVSHTVSILCNDDENFPCGDPVVVLIPELKYSNYLIVIEALNPSQYASSSFELQGFFVNFIDVHYTNYLFGLRYTFLCVSMITVAIYLYRMRNLRAFSDWVIEQKAILVLSFLLILFNNPFYALVILVPGEASFFFSTLFTVNFCIYLYGFWWTTYQRIRLENQQKATKTLTIWKGIFLLLLWVFVLTSLCLLNHFYLEDPGFDFDTEYQKTYLAFLIIAMLFCAFAALALLREIIYIFMNFKTRIWRQKLLFALSSFFIFAFFVFIFSGSFSSFNDNGSRVLLSIGIMNLYVFALQLLYVPTKRGIRETQEIERNENYRPEMQYDVLEDNINIEFHSPYNDQGGIQMQPHDHEEIEAEIQDVPHVHQNVLDQDASQLDHDASRLDHSQHVENPERIEDDYDRVL